MKVGGDESDVGEVERKNEDEYISEVRDEGSEWGSVVVSGLFSGGEFGEWCCWVGGWGGRGGVCGWVWVVVGDWGFLRRSEGVNEVGNK